MDFKLKKKNEQTEVVRILLYFLEKNVGITIVGRLFDGLGQSFAADLLQI